MAAGSNSDDATAPATLEGSGPVLVRPDAPSSRGDQVGRFTLLEEIGRGAMGVVWSAYDPELDRKVALKLVGAPLDWLTEESGSQERFRREAQLMAKLRHPNVVTLYEVGRHRDEWFLAMEFVASGTLAGFAQECRSQPDGRKRILEAYLDAARGMAAAHELSIVHGDFKPSNVLIDDGRALVADFGLARQRQAEPEQGEAALDSDGTALAGTPRYMAPELFDRKPASARTDQFAFCVSLYESFTGESPFEGQTPMEIRVSIIEGRRRPTPSESIVPRWVMEVIERGLRPDPDERWGSMQELSVGLESPDQSASDRRSRAVVGVTLVLIVLCLPLFALTELVPGPFEDYLGAVIVPALMLGVVGSFYTFGRERIAASPFNRKVFSALAVIFAFDLVLTSLLWRLDVSIDASNAIGLGYWSSMAAMFGVAIHRGALWLSLAYAIACIGAVLKPEYIVWYIGVANLFFIVTAYTIWKDPRANQLA